MVKRKMLKETQMLQTAYPLRDLPDIHNHVTIHEVIVPIDFVE
jgi:hypothetical protein